MSDRITIHPLTPERWKDFARLFGEKGACGGCWCMFWRLPRREYEAKKGAGNRRAMKKLVDGDREPGLIAYAGDQPVGWCSIAPRPEYRHFETSRILAPVDDAEVWSVVCFFIARRYRRRGLARKLLASAVGWAAQRGARIIEGYPVDRAQERMPDVFAYTGFASTFRAAGFVEVARRSETRPIMRYDVGSTERTPKAGKRASKR